MKASLVHVAHRGLNVHLSVKDGQQETLEISTTLRADGLFQRHIIFLQVHVFNGLQINLIKQKNNHYMLFCETV